MTYVSNQGEAAMTSTAKSDQSAAAGSASPKRPDNEQTAEHAEISLLIPWYANGTLDAAQRRSVVRHLEGCAECRLDLDQMQLTQTRWQHAPTAVEPRGNFARLMAAIEAAEAQAPTPAPAARTRKAPRAAWWQSAAEWLGAGQLGLSGGGLALASVAGALVVVAVVRQAPPGDDASSFHTLATRGSMANLTDRDLRVVFDPTTNPEQIAKIFAKINAQIIDGPSGIGAYTVRLDGAADDAASVAAVAEKLRLSPLVMLAEPALPPKTGTPVQPH